MRSTRKRRRALSTASKPGEPAYLPSFTYSPPAKACCVFFFFTFYACHYRSLTLDMYTFLLLLCFYLFHTLFPFLFFSFDPISCDPFMPYPPHHPCLTTLSPIQQTTPSPNSLYYDTYLLCCSSIVDFYLPDTSSALSALCHT